MITDGLANVVANIATEKDKAAGWSYYATMIDATTAETIYRGTWMARKVAQIIPGDACREWRLWQADAATIEAIEEIEREFRVRHLVREAWVWARVFGGAAILFGLDGDQDLEKPATPGKKIKYTRVMTAQALEGDTTTITTDLASPNFGLPEIYVYRPKTTAIEQRIHYTRLVRFFGDRISPDSPIETTLKGWGESIYVGIFSAMTQAGGASAVLASLLPEAKTDVISVDGLGGLLARPEGEALIQKRFALAAMLKSVNNTLLLDKGDTYEQKQINFSQVTDVHRALFAEFCAAADVPQTRMLGQAPGGLNSTGESDLRNYYDAIRDRQENDLRPALDQIDAFVFAHAGITLGKDDWYQFAPLWTPKASESAEVEAKFATAIKSLADSGLFADEFLADIARKRMEESGQWPGIEDAADELRIEDPQEPDEGGVTDDPESA